MTVICLFFSSPLLPCKLELSDQVRLGSHLFGEKTVSVVACFITSGSRGATTPSLCFRVNVFSLCDQQVIWGRGER